MDKMTPLQGYRFFSSPSGKLKLFCSHSETPCIMRSLRLYHVERDLSVSFGPRSKLNNKFGGRGKGGNYVPHPQPFLLYFSLAKMKPNTDIQPPRCLKIV